MSPIDQLRKLCHRWGGEFVELSQSAYDDVRHFKGEQKRVFGPHRGPFYEAPFSSERLGVFWKARKLVYSGDVYWTEVIHEMGHLFASSKNPDRSDEFNFFGWEYLLAKRVGDPEEWIKTNRHYGVSHRGSEEFGSLNPKEQKQLLAEQVKCGKKLGIISPWGTPLSIYSKKIGKRKALPV